MAEPHILDEGGFAAFFDVATREAQSVANSLIECMVEPRPFAGTDDNPDGLTPGERATNTSLLAAASEVLIKDVAFQDLQGVLGVTMLRLQGLIDASTEHPDHRPLFQARQMVHFLVHVLPESSPQEVMGRVRRLRNAEGRAQAEEADAGNGPSGPPAGRSGLVTTH